MTRQHGVPILLLLLLSVSAQSLITTVLVYDADSDNATIQSCVDVLKGGDVAVRPYRVSTTKSLEDVRSDVCSSLAGTDNLAMILDYSRLPAVNSLLDGLSQQLHLPHLRMGSAFQPGFGGHDFQLQVYPGAVLQLLLLKDFLRRERTEGRWEEGVVVLPAKSSDLQNFAALVQDVKQPLVIRKWTNVMEENNRVFEEVGKSSVKNFIVGLEPEQLNEFFVLMSSRRMLTCSHRYLLVHPEASSADLSTFAYSGANIVAFRPDLGSGSAQMLAKLTGIAKDLAAPLKSPVPSGWIARCSGEAWSEGRRAMDAILAKAEASVGLLRRTGPLTCPAVNFPFTVEELTSAGYEKLFTWRGNGSFLKVERKVREKRQAPRKKMLRVTTIMDRPFVYKNSGKYSGLVIDIMSEIGRLAGFSFTYHQVKDSQYGRRGKDGKWSGMIGELLADDADVAVGPLTITYERERVVDFTFPFTTVGLIPLMKKPKLVVERMNWTAFCTPFTTKVWILVLVALVVTSLVLFVVARLSADEWIHSNESTKVNQFTLANSFWFVTGAALFRGTNLSPRATGTRLVSLVWWFFILLLLIAYAVSVQSFLTVEKMQPPIDSIEDLSLQTKLKYGVLYGGSSYSFFMKSMNPTYKRMFEFMDKESSFVSSSRMGIKRVHRGDYAYIMESAMAEYYVARSCDLMTVGSPFTSKGYGFALQKGSPFRQLFNEAILKLQANESIDMLMDKWIFETKVSCSSSGDRDDKGRMRIDYYILSGLFGGLLIGLVVALVVCILEVLVRACLPKCRGQRSFFGYLGYRLRLLFCAYNGKDVH